VMIDADTAQSSSTFRAVQIPAAASSPPSLG
jgi:hypothetical protein